MLKTKLRAEPVGSALFIQENYLNIILMAALASAAMIAAGMAFFMVVSFAVMAAGSIWIKV